MPSDRTSIACGPLRFALRYRERDGGAPHTQNAGGRGGHHPDQGVSIQVFGQVEDAETELLRFDCFENAPHYHYAPGRDNVRIMLDPTVTGNPLGWAIAQLRAKLPAMLKRAGYEELAGRLEADEVAWKVAEVEATAREMARTLRHTVTHNRGTEVIEAGNIRFGLELRRVGNDGGMAIHVLSDVAGQEIELLAFDCFRVNPHYHYGPRNRNERIFIDTTLVPDALSWVLGLFKRGKLAAMIRRAGYPTIAAELDDELIAATLPEVEARIAAMLQADTSMAAATA
jgi:hypothetical protein